MIADQIIHKAIEEITNKNFGVTQQFLEIHDIIYEGGKPKIRKVALDEENGTAVVYFSVVKQQFYFIVYLQTKPDIIVTWVEIEPGYSIYFRATSDSLNYKELSAFTMLTPTGGWNKGDKKQYGGYTYKFSAIELTASEDPGKFEDKLKELLDVLEKDNEGIINLSNRANGHIQVAIYFHNGNTMLGGPHIDKASLKRMSDLNLAIDFDLYAQGNFFR